MPSERTQSYYLAYVYNFKSNTKGRGNNVNFKIPVWLSQ